jgi:hypothetical protein
MRWLIDAAALTFFRWPDKGVGVCLRACTLKAQAEAFVYSPLPGQITWDRVG